MTRFLEMAGIGDFVEVNVKQVLVDSREVLLAKVDGEYYAVDNRCPHMGARLARGKLEGTVVTCPWHGSQFDLRDGRVIHWTQVSGLVSAATKLIKPPTPIHTYEVKVERDRIMVGL